MNAFAAANGHGKVACATSKYHLRTSVYSPSGRYFADPIGMRSFMRPTSIGTVPPE